MPPGKSLRAFSGPRHPPHSALEAHIYGVKNLYSSLIRLYAAYHINNPQLYALALFTQLGVLFLYATEHLIVRTARFKEALFPYVTSGLGLYWMWTQWGFYLH